MNKEYEISEFLIMNQDPLKDDLRECATAFLDNKIYFKGVFRIVFNMAFKNFIRVKLTEMIAINTFTDMDTLTGIIDSALIERLTGDHFYEYDI